ncbi:hypothetical protein G6L37_05085 [Agrobacterium rubi]|nr:hypothetical protein [Agrobacterium rubi]NTF24730.1 hypothetical protein [Agrobacterium rubi]
MALDFVPQGDAALAEMFQRYGIRPEASKIVGIDVLATAFNKERLSRGERVVQLSCRHSAVSKNRRSMVCPRCDQLMRHGMDYDSWIRGVTIGYDGLRWPDDPLRLLNERTDLEGRYFDEPAEYDQA